MYLDFSSLEKAVSSLEKAILRAEKTKNDDILRDAVIQRFEYTYELCWKMLKRQIEMDSPTPALVDTLSFKELIREGAEKGFIDDVAAWIMYREQRNITSHVYNENKAISVYNTAVEFLKDAKSLLNKLKKNKNDSY
ncbi:MAG: nucleotidyltransferase substrate binding protein, HI0074 family [uncultured bacterium]|nr:MAG: nucleotidyltransferase substrate binding protein, HI0074 family [uncultured bacterium]